MSNVQPASSRTRHAAWRLLLSRLLLLSLLSLLSLRRRLLLLLLLLLLHDGQSENEHSTGKVYRLLCTARRVRAQCGCKATACGFGLLLSRSTSGANQELYDRMASMREIGEWIVRRIGSWL